MANESDTLNIGSLQLRKEFPMNEVQGLTTPKTEAKPGAKPSRAEDPVLHPHAAAAARARIAAAKDIHPLSEGQGIPATPTVDLITDKTRLAGIDTDQPLVHRRKLPSILAPVLTAAGIFLVALLVFKAPIIWSQLQYAAGDHPATADQTNTPTAIVPSENTITIAKINVHAPVVYEPSVQEAAVQKSLESGVVHYGNTAVPGQIGNVAIFGHSSNDWWEPGNYKFVFVLLDKLVAGDKITVDYQSVRYTYEVTGSKVVEPTDVGVLNPTSTPTLTLITCTPPGTSLKRLVVTAKQISPDPSTSTAVASGQVDEHNPASLTSSTQPSFFDQLTAGIEKLFTGGQ